MQYAVFVRLAGSGMCMSVPPRVYAGMLVTDGEKETEVHDGNRLCMSLKKRAEKNAIGC